MKNVILIICLISTTFLMSCNNETNAPYNVSVSRTILHSAPKYYLMAFHSPIGHCGFDELSPDVINQIIKEGGGAYFGCAFCCKTESGYRLFTAKHTFNDCPPNPYLKVENYDVVSYPFDYAINGFEIAKPKNGSIITIKGFRVINTNIEWLEIKGKMESGTLKDCPMEDEIKPTWNPGKVWLMKVDSTLNYENMKGLSGAPVFNDKGKVVALFSGIYPIKNGEYLADGIYLRLEQLIK